jgi:hypothetical protein
MTKLLAVVALLFAACSDSTPTAAATPPPTWGTGATSPASSDRASASNNGLTGGVGQPSVDPTMPSWAPKSCLAYHTAVVLALDCVAIDQIKRDEIGRAYGVASKGWKAEQDGTPTKIEQVSLACERSTASVNAASEGKCVLART